MLQVKTGDPRAKQDIDNMVSQQRANYIQSILALRELVDSTTRRYTELARDETVKSALATLDGEVEVATQAGAVPRI